MTKVRNDSNVPICLDLEGTLIRAEPGIEAIVSLILRRPWYLPLALFWLLRGPTYLQKAAVDRVGIDPKSLPYQRDLLEYLRSERLAGRSIVLLTSTGRAYVRCVADHLGVFDAIVTNDTPTRWTGPQKASALSQRFGMHGFDFVGHSSDDMAAWTAARIALVVDGSDTLLSQVRSNATLGRTFQSKLPNVLFGCFLALRPHQWLKNFLIFLPALAAHRFVERQVWLPALFAFVAFCCAASAGYVLNDLLDLPSDRRHPRKWQRPFASGSVPIVGGLGIGLVLLGMGLSIAYFLRPGFLACLLIYLVGTIAYSSWLKRKAIVDVLTLAGLYTLRILAGASATNIVPSFWLLALSMFFFMDLACVKRCVELQGTKLDEKSLMPGRGYGSVDRETLFTVGTNSGLMAVLVLALYINNSGISALYPNPEVLWGLCPLLLYWTSRIWILVRRGLLHDDPLVFAVRDRISLFSFAALALLLWLGSLHHLNLVKFFFSK